MFKWTSYNSLYAWGLGLGGEVRYAMKSEPPVPFAFVVQMTLLTRIFEFAFIWGDPKHWEEAL